jgi:hypothetical protein
MQGNNPRAPHCSPVSKPYPMKGLLKMSDQLQDQDHEKDQVDTSRQEEQAEKPEEQNKAARPATKKKAGPN